MNVEHNVEWMRREIRAAKQIAADANARVHELCDHWCKYAAKYRVGDTVRIAKISPEPLQYGFLYGTAHHGKLARIDRIRWNAGWDGLTVMYEVTVMRQDGTPGAQRTALWDDNRLAINDEENS